MASQINPDLQRERHKGSFNKELLTYILRDGEQATRRRRHIEKLFEDDEEYKGVEFHFMSRDEAYEEGVRKSVIMLRRIKELGLTDPSDANYYRECVFPNENCVLDLHNSMFLNTIAQQMSPEQKDKWLKRAKNFEICGTYAQTELGHGTFLRGLETTATLDLRTDEFVINCPTKTASKWWPGALGKTTDHAIVMAIMHISGKNHGPHLFMVQTRDLKTHMPMPGITLGDIGPKFGFDMMDNGFLHLTHIRVPRENLFMNFVKVQKDGTYIKAQHSKLSYGAMVNIRAGMVETVCAKNLSKACTIAIRYSCVRRQSELEPGQPEPPVLDFQSQQYRLFTQLASAYAFTFAGKHMRNIYSSITAEIQEGNVDSLPELHGLSCGLKAYASYQSGVGIEVCRLCCGGHGYAHYSGLPKIYVVNTPSCTYEGENNVMLLQCARFLNKSMQTARSGGKLSGTVGYLTEAMSPCSLDQNFHLKSIVDAYKHRARRMVKEAVENVDQLVSQGLKQYNAWNQSHFLLQRAAEVHVQQYIMRVFMERIAGETNPAIIRVLTRLAQLYGLRDIVEQSGDFLVDGYTSPAQLKLSQQKFISLLGEIRPDAVSLVDAFDFIDRVLGSAIGSYDGNAYDNMIKFAKESPLNKHEVHPAILKYMKPPGRNISKL